MKNGLMTLLVIIACSSIANAQQKKVKNIDQFTEFTLGLGSSQATGAIGYVHNWQVGKRKKFELGLGAKFTSYFATDINYSTAPAKLTSGKTGLGVLFSETIPANIDTVFFPKSQVNMLNITLNLGYNITPRLYAGFTIDAVGFSFGKQQNGTYFSNEGTQGRPVTAKPTGFNLLLTSDNDLGSLNSEIFARYKISKKLGVKLGYQFLFAEYTTNTKIQTTPGGKKNDRFRNKMSGVGLGVTYHF